MKMARFSTSLLAVVFALSVAACGEGSMISDERPDMPQKVMEKKTDPRKCEKYKGTGAKRKCIKWDDKDYIIVTTDGTAYDVDQPEYDSVNVGDFWPR